MKKKTRIAALVCAGLSPCVMAQSIEGTVLTQSGKPLVGASVELEGSNIATKTDENGKFVFSNVRQGNNEIHISAEGFSHLHEDVQISGSQSVTRTFTASRSPIEVIDVTASPIHLSSMESAMPVSVLGGERLRRQQSATLGDSLEKLAGVHSSFHAKVASTPVIRGLSGPRVLITQNGLDVSDVSRVGPDHAVAGEAATAQQIEVLRGPSTLFYGSGAIGGVVNIVDTRVPTNGDTQGEWLVEHSSVDDQKLASFNATSGVGSFAFYADGFVRDSNDYEVPVAPELAHDDHHHEDEHEHDETHDESGDFTVGNSSEESNGFTLGTSYLFEQGYVGVSVEQFNREYGIPGHSHGDEEGHDHGHDHGDETEGESGHGGDVFADLEQTRVQLLSEMRFDDSILAGINVRAGFTDYEHAEIEGGVAGTTFENTTYELRLELLHQPFMDFNGGISFHYKNSDVAAEGSEAFTPPSETEMFAVAVMEERHFGDVLLQLGGRIERVTMNADRLLLPMLDAHPHDDEHGDEGHDHDHDHDHDHGGDGSITRTFFADHEFTPVSLSIGAVWDFMPGYNAAVSFSRSQRAPSASELLSFGPHIGTRSYEIGALFALEDHNGESEIGLTDEIIDLETANNIDLTLRKTQEDVGFIFNVFYNEVDNYYYQTNTGLFADDGHNHGGDDGHDHGGHDHGDDGHDDHSGELPVYIFQTDDVVLHGFEAQVAWQVTDEFNATFFSDLVRARLKDGGDLPRTPPVRFGTQFSYENNRISAHLDITRYQSQDKIADFETETDGYTLVDLAVSYDLPVWNNALSVYLNARNLTDTEARVHTSFLKDIAPRPGRNFSIGLKGYF
ncbi:TonB-dependent receptor [Alteromonas oceanisediminis]|uniref:TonB-dependent receptor n=1 Tax=Alteromonas oceanisediminis TaxID=2836180 RepID=UPI001BDB54E2|nr:TonB-dependent receptor [Alteromonas oceanisediminis]MBT0585958.1 TonB-dependent receptor [Alteromonas oceanisediminis]